MSHVAPLRSLGSIGIRVGVRQPLPQGATVIGVLGEVTLLRYIQETVGLRTDVETVAADAEEARLQAVETAMADGSAFITRPLPGLAERYSLGAVTGLIDVAGDLETLLRVAPPAYDLPDLPRDPRELWNGFALTTRQYKQIWYPAEERRQAFDLSADPAETTDVADEHRGQLSPGWSTLARELERATVGEIDPADVERVRRRLEGLGYID